MAVSVPSTTPSQPIKMAPWQVLFASQNDCAFITTMGFNVKTFTTILASDFAEQWYNTLIPHNDATIHANPHAKCRSLDAGGALGLILHYLDSTMH